MRCQRYRVPRLQGEDPFVRMAPGAVDVWLSEVDTAASGTSDPALVRLGLALTRGLLLDLVATDDDAGVTSTAQAFADLVRGPVGHTEVPCGTNSGPPALP
jgi:hypothetical protein